MKLFVEPYLRLPLRVESDQLFAGLNSTEKHTYNLKALKGGV